MLVIITVFSFWYQQRWGTVADTSWLITVNERMLGGERLYVDLLETNPPFSVWLYTMPVWVAQQLGLAPELLVQAWTYVAALAGLLFAGFIVRRAGFPEAAALTALAPLPMRCWCFCRAMPSASASISAWRSSCRCSSCWPGAPAVG